MGGALRGKGYMQAPGSKHGGSAAHGASELGNGVREGGGGRILAENGNATQGEERLQEDKGVTPSPGEHATSTAQRSTSTPNCEGQQDEPSTCKEMAKWGGLSIDVQGLTAPLGLT